MSGECLTVTCADPLARDEDFLNWLRVHGLEPTVIHTVHVYDDYMTVEGYELNADGRKFYDIDRRGIAEFEPFDVRLKERMPR